MSDSATLLQAVAEAARLGGRRALERSSAMLASESKADGSPVTAVDREVETLLREWIMRRFPDDGILGEEIPEHRPGAERRWIVDPIDGTHSYMRGVPLWGTLVAITRGTEVIAGAIACAAANDLVCASQGEGCWWNDSRCRVSDVAEVSRATVLTTDERLFPSPAHRDRWRALVDLAGTVRGWSDCYGYVLLATGRADVVVDGRMSPWDAAAPCIVIDEAGGVFTDLEGRPGAFGGSVVATNAALAKEARKVLRVG
jgi:histidinol phosphatase-like enzyme (inositol monophosphatase family)